MKTINRNLIAGSMVLLLAAGLAACGGGGGADSGNMQGAPGTPQQSMMPGGGGGGDWQEMKIDGATVRFEMPKPIKMQEDASVGQVLYVSQNTKEKMSFRVGITKRNYDEDQKKGLTDEQVLTQYAQKVLAASQQQFAQMGFKTQFQPNGSAKLATGIAQEYVGQVGKATVVERFYVNKQGLYMVEATTQNTENPDFVRFLNSFTP